MASVPSLVTSLPGYVTTSVSTVRVSKLRSRPSSLGNLTSLLLLETSRLFSPSNSQRVLGNSLMLLPEIFRVCRFFKFPIQLGSCLILLFCKHRACGTKQCEVQDVINTYKINYESLSESLLSLSPKCFIFYLL